MATGHQVAGLAVGSITNLYTRSAFILFSSNGPAAIQLGCLDCVRSTVGVSYLGHGSLTLEPPTDAVVNTLRLAP